MTEQTTNNESGTSLLYEALNTKAKQMAEALNKIDLKNVSLDDAKDKTFDRVRAMWNDSSGLAEAIKSLGELTGKIQVKEKGEKQPFVSSIAEDRK